MYAFLEVTFRPFFSIVELSDHTFGGIVFNVTIDYHHHLVSMAITGALVFFSGDVWGGATKWPGAFVF